MCFKAKTHPACSEPKAGRKPDSNGRNKDTALLKLGVLRREYERIISRARAGYAVINQEFSQ